MIGKIVIGKSFRGCINYCLEDKLHEQSNQLVIKNRAEVLSYNLCFGDRLDLIGQFNDVRNLNPNLSKPVMHITLSFPPGEFLTKGKLVSLAEDCAEDLGFAENQYIVIAHNDTNHQHIHIVANRVGFDGKTVKDNHNYQKMATYCRRMELKHGLQQVLNPRRYLQKDQRRLPRLDHRKEKLRQDIRECLVRSKTYPEFEQRMRQRNYQVVRARGIAFVDRQKVRVKGSEVGYSLSKIEKIFSMQPELKTKVLQSSQLILPQKDLAKENQQKERTELSLKPVQDQQGIDPAFLKKKKRKKRSFHL